MDAKVGWRVMRFALGLLDGMTMGIVAQAATPTAATSSTQPTATPAWPDNGIAQRRIGAVGPGGAGVAVMFVEDDRGTLRAWVLEFCAERLPRTTDYVPRRRAGAAKKHAERVGVHLGQIAPFGIGRSRGMQFACALTECEELS